MNTFFGPKQSLPSLTKNIDGSYPLVQVTDYPKLSAYLSYLPIVKNTCVLLVIGRCALLSFFPFPFYSYQFILCIQYFIVQLDKK